MQNNKQSAKNSVINVTGFFARSNFIIFLDGIDTSISWEMNKMIFFLENDKKGNQDSDKDSFLL